MATRSTTCDAESNLQSLTTGIAISPNSLIAILDWGQASYGSLYVDLPNYFNRDDALLYRDALAEFGHAIPRDEFLVRYDAIQPYPGFKYFSFGLWNWRYGSPPHRETHVQHFVDMVLK